MSAIVAGTADGRRAALGRQRATADPGMGLLPPARKAAAPVPMITSGTEDAAPGKGVCRVRSVFQQELEVLQQDVLRMGTIVEECIGEAVRALNGGDETLAQEIIARDDVVDQMQRDIETHCLEMIALQQPIGGDLRIVSTAIKMAGDLERMADHAVDIARVTLRIKGQPLLLEIARMAEIAQGMTRDALLGYVRRDIDVARTLSRADDIVDHLYSRIMGDLILYMAEDPRTIHHATHLVFVAQHLERVADHATNLGESVVFLVSGERQALNR